MIEAFWNGVRESISFYFIGIMGGLMAQVLALFGLVGGMTALCIWLSEHKIKIEKR